MIVEKGVGLYEKYFSREDSALTTTEDKLTRIINDPEKRDVYIEVMGAIRERSASKMTKEQKEARARKGGEARAKKLTAEQRKEIARLGGMSPKFKDSE